MVNSIFSTYRNGENRVTAAILAVLGSLSLQRSQRILSALLEESEFELVSFQNQPSEGHAGVPDAEIRSNVRILFETKIKRGSIKSTDQITRHLRCFSKKPCEGVQKLLVLTPDSSQPEVISKVNDSRVQWTSFAALDQAIAGIFEDANEVVSEREAFLLRELQAMLRREKLLESEKDTLVIPAKNAWPEYNEYHAYVCQSDRFFQHVKYLAFYARNKIYPFVPKIMQIKESVAMIRDGYKGEIGILVNRLLDDKIRTEGKTYKVILLSPPDSKETIKLKAPIENDLKSKEGRTVAFTQNQRYVNSHKLAKADYTSQLI